MYIKVKVTAGAKKEKVKEIWSARFEVSVKEKAERNMANRRIIEIFENHFKAWKKVKIISGHQSRSKMLSIDVDSSGA